MVCVDYQQDTSQRLLMQRKWMQQKMTLISRTGTYHWWAPTNIQLAKVSITILSFHHFSNRISPLLFYTIKSCELVFILFATTLDFFYCFTIIRRRCFFVTPFHHLIISLFHHCVSPFHHVNLCVLSASLHHIGFTISPYKYKSVFCYIISPFHH